MEHLDAVDLNLLPPLSALLEERQVTRAAHRSGLSQPAMSRALARLRQQLDDQLLVRDKGGYVLTPRAERIQRQLAAVMSQLETLFAPEVFDPATAEEHYHLAATDYPLVLFLHQVAREVNMLAPRCTVRIESAGDSVYDDIVHGRIDLSFYVAALSPMFRQELLFEDVCVCVMSADHPLAKHKRLTLDQYLGCSHLVIDIVDGDQPLIASRLSELGVSRRASVTLPLFLGAEAVVPDTPLVATLNKRLVDAFADDPRLAVVAAPTELEPFQYFMFWHPRLDHDPAQKWLRDRVRVSTATTLAGPFSGYAATRQGGLGLRRPDADFGRGLAFPLTRKET